MVFQGRSLVCLPLPGKVTELFFSTSPKTLFPGFELASMYREAELLMTTSGLKIEQPMFMLSHFKLCLTLCDPLDCSLPGSTVHRIFQEGILEWVAISFSTGSSPPMHRTCVSCRSCITGKFFTTEPLRKPKTVSSVQSLSRVRLFATP